MKSLAIVVLSLVAGPNVAGPAELLTPNVPGRFELAVEEPRELRFEDYAPLSPDATAHVDPTGSAAASMRAAVDVWTAGEDDILLREVTRWGSDADARAFVDQAVVVGTDDGLDPTAAPFEGGVAFVGATKGLWTRTIAWQQGVYGMTVSHFAVGDESGDIIVQAATALAEAVEGATGQPIDGANAIDEPADATSSSGGIGIVTVVLLMVVVGGAVLLVVKIRRLRAANAEARRGSRTDVDDIIERARARSRAEREIEKIPDPTRPDDDWTPPDDY